MTKTLLTITVTALLLCSSMEAATKAEASKAPLIKSVVPSKISSVAAVKTAPETKFAPSTPAGNTAKIASKTTKDTKPAAKSRQNPKWTQIGNASWYGSAFNGHKTASGEPFNMQQFTAAHQTLPIGTWVKVTNLRNKKSIYVRINDRGPFVGNRVLDLSYRAADILGFSANGLAKVKIETVEAQAVALDLSPTSLF